MIGRTSLVLALLGASSVAQAATGGTLYYLEFDGDPRSDKTYYLNTIDVAADGTATFGSRVPLTGTPTDRNYAPQSMVLTADGSLVGTYGGNRHTQLFVIDAADVADLDNLTSVPVTMGGTLSTTIEGAFVGCDGELYLGDSGTDNTGAGGGVIRIDQSTLFDTTVSYETVITTNATDIDGLGPGVVDNQVVDSPGLAIDSTRLLTWDFVDGTVTLLGTIDTNYELHALGGDRFDDGQARVLGLDAHPFVALPITLEHIDPSVPSDAAIATGPTVRATGLAGPMDCTVSTITGESAPGGDADGDGVLDDEDAFPDDPTEWLDSDGDGVGDNSDAFPADSSEWLDTDGDGVGDNADLFPEDPNETGDEDGDGVGDNADVCAGWPNTDTDGDGVCDTSDTCPTDATNADEDADGVCDVVDVCVGLDNVDSDGDQVCDDLDICLGNDASGDTDADGVCDFDDNCPDDANADQADADADDVGDACEADSDLDGVIDDDDNCPAVSNATQDDLDGDGAGDVCDADDDGDGVADADDNCPFYVNADQADLDGDGFGDACDGDDDADGVADDVDSCPATPFGAPFDALGCSGEQRVELVCGEPSDYGWRTHGQYVRCVVKESKSAYRSGLITRGEKASLIRAAAWSLIGRFLSRLRRWC